MFHSTPVPNLTSLTISTQLNVYRDELRHFEDLATSSRDTGRMEAANLYEERIHALEEQLFQMEREKVLKGETERANALAASQAAEAAERLRELTVRLQELQVALDDACVEKESLSEAASSKDAQISHYESERSRHVAESEAAAAEVLAHKSHVDALRQSLIEHEAKVVELQGLLAAARHQLAERQHDGSASEETVTLQCRVTELEDEKEALITRIQTVAQTTEVAVQDRLRAYEETIKTLEQKSAEQVQEIGALTERVAAEKRLEVELEAELFQTQKLAELQQRRVATQEAQCRELQAEQADLHEQISGLRRKLAAAVERSSISVSARTSQEGSLLPAPYVLQGHFQETVTSLQIQMEAVKNINTLVVENIRGELHSVCIFPT